jgi:hypothetical protein
LWGVVVSQEVLEKVEKRKVGKREVERRKVEKSNVCVAEGQNG